jgi:hypothetical protein
MVRTGDQQGDGDREDGHDEVADDCCHADQISRPI